MRLITPTVCFAICAFLCGHAFAQTAPKLLPFQGRLTDQNGIAVSNGVRLVQFKIYDVPSGGSPVWAGELHRTTVNGGLINVLLGSKTPFTGVDFDRQLYLEITVDINGDNSITLADPPMLPRQAILPVIFAKEAADSRKLNGYDWTPIFGTNSPNVALPASKLADGSVPGAKIQSATITSNQIAPLTITASQMAAATITSNQIAPAAITRANLDANLLLDAIIPPGTIFPFAGPNVPAGWLPCDGRATNRTDLPRLFTAIGTCWGNSAGGTNTFNLPDLRGLFLRGLEVRPSGQGRDPDVANRISITNGGNTGPNVGSFQNDEIKSHQHAEPWWNSFEPYGGEANSGETIGGGASAGNYRKSFVKSAGGSESRPRNAYVNYIIKY
jgi:hypothetical protein